MKVLRGIVVLALAVVVARYLLPVSIGTALASDGMEYVLNSVEYGDIKEETKQESYWNNIKKGMLAGEKMMLELNQLEMAYTDENDRNQHYSKWKTNRKIFIYPEDWIEPEPRDDKSGLFQELEDELRENQVE